MAPDVVTCPLLRVVLWELVASFAFAEETSVTVNVESFLEIVTKKIVGLDSKMDLVLRACGNEHNGQTVDPSTENRICSMSSRIIKMENEIDYLKSSAGVPQSGGWSSTSDRKVADMVSNLDSKVSALQNSFEGEKLRIYALEQRVLVPNKTVSFISAENGSMLDRKVLDIISNVESKVAALQNSFESQKLKTIDLEQRVQELNDTASSVAVEKEANLGNQTCNFKKVGERNLVNYLLKVNSNIFLGKPSNASSHYDSTPHTQVRNALDGDFVSQYHSKQESDPWVFVDLKASYFIWEIRVIIREASRAAGIIVYVSDDVTFLANGKIDVKSLQLFGHQVGDYLSTTLTFKKPDGMCGRYVAVYRAVHHEYLIIKEIQGTGYVFD